MSEEGTNEEQGSEERDSGQGPGAGGQGSRDGKADDRHDPRVKELSEEAKGYRLKLREEEAKVEKAEAKLTEYQKQTEQSASELSRLKSELATAKTDNVIVSEAIRFGFYDPEDAVRLIDRDKLGDTDGKVTGVEDALKALAEKKRHLVRDAGAKDAGARGTAKSTDMNAWLLDQ